jgi:hypothetical protein
VLRASFYVLRLNQARRTQNAEPRTPNEARRTQNEERRTDLHTEVAEGTAEEELARC